MNDLLTTRQVQDLLKVDRITIYRMLLDGRLRGVKIGQQWRFPAHEVDRLIRPESSEALPSSTNLTPIFPTHCVQTIQDLFSEVAQVSSITIDRDGNPITNISLPSRLYTLLNETRFGHQAHLALFSSIAKAALDGSTYFTCTSGLQHIAAPIVDRDTTVGFFLIGQFYWHAPDQREEQDRVRRLAYTHNLPVDMVFEAAREIPVIPSGMHQQMEKWPQAASRAIQSILLERSNFMDRLQKIANLTQIS